MIRTFLWSLKDRGEDFDCIDLPSPENISLPSSLNVLTPEQAVELLLLFSQNNKSNDRPIHAPDTVSTDSDELANEDLPSATTMEDSESSSTESSIEFIDANSARVDVQTMQTIEIKNISTENLSIPAATKSTNIKNPTRESDPRQSVSDAQVEYIDDKSESNQVISSASERPVDVGNVDLEQITDEICQQKFDELKQLLNDAHKAMTNIVSSQERLNTIDKGKERNADVAETKADDPSSRTCAARAAVVQHSAASSSSSCNLDDDSRAGKYKKKPAPKAPLASHEDAVSENESENALKATLVIKTGTLKTFSNADATKDVFLAHIPHSVKKKKKSSKSRAKESFSKLLTIPKNIFHSAFHKEQNESSSKEEDSSSTLSETSGSASRSDSVGSQAFASAKLSTSMQDVNVEEIPLKPERHDNTKNPDKDVNSSAEKLDTQIAISNKPETDFGRVENNEKNGDATNERLENYEKNIGNNANLEIREAPQSSHSGRKEIVTDIN